MDWFEDEEFWSGLYPYMFPAERFAASAEQVAQVVALTQFAGRNVLDLGCGPSRHAVEFARLGHVVTGVDRTRFLRARAEERAADAGVAVEWVLQDMRAFRRAGAFDLACSLFTSFGYFETGQEDLQVLRNVCESLRAGGVFVLEMLGKERLARVYQPVICTDYPDGAMVLQRHEVRNDWCRVRNEWYLLKSGHYRTFHFEHTIYSGRELKDRLLASGFAPVDLFGGLDGSPYGPDAARLVAVAHKAS